jgi:hypothetical protein
MQMTFALGKQAMFTLEPSIVDRLTTTILWARLDSV